MVEGKRLRWQEHAQRTAQTKTDYFASGENVREKYNITDNIDNQVDATITVY
jgi:hypothetical protein